MDYRATITEVIRETQELVRRAAHDRRKSLWLSPEVAAMLDAVRKPTVADRTVYPMEEAPPDLEESGTAYSEVFPTDDERLPEAAREKAPEVIQGPDADRLAALKELEKTVRACTKCELCRGRKQAVFSDGNPYAELVFVGEAPGGDEDRIGKPFVGRAGQLLTDIIEKGMKLKRRDVYICNVIKCRPPENRNPTLDEVDQCEPYLIRQLELVRPKLICALGTYAAHSLLKSTEPVGKLRGKWYFYHGIPLRVTFHPAYLLRNPADKSKTWMDVKEILKVLNGEVTPQPEGRLL